MKSKSLVLAAAVISLGVFSGCRYEMIRMTNENRNSAQEVVFRIDKFTGQVSRCNYNITLIAGSGRSIGGCIDIQESPEQITLLVPRGD